MPNGDVRIWPLEINLISLVPNEIRMRIFTDAGKYVESIPGTLLSPNSTLGTEVHRHLEAILLDTLVKTVY